MRFFRYESNGGADLAVVRNGVATSLASLDAGYPSDVCDLVSRGPSLIDEISARLDRGEGARVDRNTIRLLNPVASPSKIICIGLNYQDHADETKLATTAFPTVFARYNSTLIGPGDAILRPKVSQALDFEVELVAVVGKRAHYVPLDQALDYVAGYAVANDACPIGPDFVTADELPAGGKGLSITTRLNGEVVQSSTTSLMIFDVATLIHKLSEVMSLEPGDVILTGTPSGIGHARKPPLYMKPGDLCECEVERVCVLSNPVQDEI
jgi:acylpyruvate hydrolase